MTRRTDGKLLVEISAKIDELREVVETLIAERDAALADAAAWKARCLGHTPAAKEER